MDVFLKWSQQDHEMASSTAERYWYSSFALLRFFGDKPLDGRSQAVSGVDAAMMARCGRPDGSLRIRRRRQPKGATMTKFFEDTEIKIPKLDDPLQRLAREHNRMGELVERLLRNIDTELGEKDEMWWMELEEDLLAIEARLDSIRCLLNRLESLRIGVSGTAARVREQGTVERWERFLFRPRKT